MPTQIGSGDFRDCSEFIWKYSFTFFVHNLTSLTCLLRLKFVGDIDGFSSPWHICYVLLVAVLSLSLFIVSKCVYVFCVNVSGVVVGERVSVDVKRSLTKDRSAVLLMTGPYCL